MLGCMIESSILISAAAHLAELCDYLDLDGNILITNDPYVGVTSEKGILSFAAAPEKYGLRSKTSRFNLVLDDVTGPISISVGGRLKAPDDQIPVVVRNISFTDIRGVVTTDPPKQLSEGTLTVGTYSARPLSHRAQQCERIGAPPIPAIAAQ